MPVLIVDTNAPRVVIVKDVGNVGGVRASNSAVVVPDQGATVGNALDNTRVVNVSSTGVQGLAGAAGGTSETRVASTALGGDRVLRSTGLGTVGYATNDNLLHGDDTVGMSFNAASSGANITVLRTGSITMAGWAWTPQSPVFLGRNGLPTQTAPDPAAGDMFSQVIGHAESADTIYVQIEPPIYFS